MSTITWNRVTGRMPASPRARRTAPAVLGPVFGFGLALLAVSPAAAQIRYTVPDLTPIGFGVAPDTRRGGSIP